ncbi:MAG: ABC transporter ATP-binding protein [Lewinellaceae bacterium]|nr:ABC transporter ATP-binding protein [Lewinellaceae bacterium]
MHTLLFAKGRYLPANFLRARWQPALGAFLLDLSANVCVLVFSLLLAQMLAVLFGFNSVRGRLFFDEAIAAETVFAWLAGILLLKFALDYWRLRLRGILSEDFAHYLRTLAFEQHLRTDPAYHERRDAGRSLLRFSGDLGSAQRLLAHGVLQYTADLTLLLMGLGLVAWLDWRMATSALALILVGGLATRWVNARILVVETVRRSKKAGLLALVNDTLSRLTSIQALNRDRRTQRYFEKKAGRVRRLGRRYHTWAAASSALPLQIVQWQLLAALVWGRQLGLEGGSMLVVALILMSCRTPLSRVLRAGLVWRKGLLSLEKMDLLLQSPKHTAGASRLESRRANTLRLRGVSLVLAGREILNNIDLELNTGDMVCLYAPTGGGKTALIKLLAGLYAPTSGTVEWDGLRVETLQIQGLRRQVSFVSDAFPLSGNTPLDALSNGSGTEAMARAEVLLEDWKRRFPALQSVDLHDRHALQKISMGQQRLLQCLRAVIADKPFLLLDDPFVGLDPETASRLGRLLLENRKDKALLLLTAHPSSAAHFGWPGTPVPLDKK